MPEVGLFLLKIFIDGIVNLGIYLSPGISVLTFLSGSVKVRDIGILVGDIILGAISFSLLYDFGYDDNLHLRQILIKWLKVKKI